MCTKAYDGGQLAATVRSVVLSFSSKKNLLINFTDIPDEAVTKIENQILNRYIYQ